MMKKKLARIILFLLTLAVLAFNISAAQTESAFAAAVINTSVLEIQSFGNLVLAVSGSGILDEGYAYGDIVTATINGQSIDMPICSNYADVDKGNSVLRVVVDPTSADDFAIIAINTGDLATDLGLATKIKHGEEAEYSWELCEGVKAPIPVTIRLNEAGAYYAQWTLRQLTRTNERSDYAALSDEEFANFRAITTSGMGVNLLYRSSSPINPELGRNAYADAATKAAGIRTCVNLADSANEARGHGGWANTYYSTCKVIELNLGMDITAPDFIQGLKDGLRFMLNNDAPYLVHCNEGKDRTGFVAALLECLMGAAPGEVVADYMTTYYNFYHVDKDTEQYNVIASSNIIATLQTTFGIDDLFSADVDLAAEAKDYLLAIGLTEDEVVMLQAKLR